MFLNNFFIANTEQMEQPQTLALAEGVVIEKIEQTSPEHLKIHVKDICVLTLKGNYAGTYFSNFDQILKRNGLTREDLLDTVNEYVEQEKCCTFVYNDPTLQINHNKFVTSKIGWPYFVTYSGEEFKTKKGPRVPFAIPSSSNTSYEAKTHYRIYLPAGPIKGVVFDIYGGGIDRLYYPIYVQSDQVPTKEYNLITLYKRFFRTFLKKGIAVVTLRLADCRVKIKDPFNTYYSDDPFVFRQGQHLSIKHQAFYIREMDLIKKEIKNFLNYFPQICPRAAHVPKIFLGMSFGGIVGQFIAQNRQSEDWFDHYIFMQTPTYEFKGIVGDTIYDVMENMTYLNKKLFFIFGELDKRIHGGHDTFFLKKIKRKDLIKVRYLEGVGHHVPPYPNDIIEEILEFCGIE